jgi:hypothetical protein
MPGRTRRATAIGAAAFALAGSAALAVPGTASAAEVKTVPCGSTVQASPGDTIHGTLLGLPLIDLGVIGTVSKTLTTTVNALLGTVCTVTVNVVNTVVSPVPVIGPPLAGAVNQGVEGATQGLSDVNNKVGSTLQGQQPPAQGSPPAGGSPQSPGGSPSGAPSGGTPAGVTPIPDSNSPILTGGFTSSPNYSGLPFSFSSGYSPMRDYSNIPMVNAGLYSPSPGVRYGSQVPGYSPEFGILGQNGKPAGSSGIQNAGQAEALPGEGSGGMAGGPGIPVLVAVLLLSGVSAGLVRTWVLRRMAAAV